MDFRSFFGKKKHSLKRRKHILTFFNDVKIIKHTDSKYDLNYEFTELFLIS